MTVRLKRQLHLLAERVVRMPPRMVAGAPRPVLRASVSAIHEDLATVEGIGPFSAMRGNVDFVDVSIESLEKVRSAVTLAGRDGNGSPTFHVNLFDALGVGRNIDMWSMPIEIFLTLEPPTDPRVDPTDPWTWDATRQPELPVVGIAMHTVARQS